MDRRSRPDPERTTLETVGDQWCYALVVVQAGEEEHVLPVSLGTGPPFRGSAIPEVRHSGGQG